MADDTITISKKQLDEILAQNKEILAENRKLAQTAVGQKDTGGMKRPETITDRTVRIAFVEGKAVQAFANRGTEERPHYVYERPDPENPKERILYVDVVFNGEKEVYPVKYNDLLRESLREECKVVEKRDTPWEVEHGTVEQKVVKDYATEETGVLVPAKVQGITSVFVVELPDGKRMEVDEKFVNI